METCVLFCCLGMTRTGMKRSCIRAGDIRIPESSSLLQPPRPHMDLDSGVQIISGKLLESTFICIKPQVYIMSELATIIILVQRPFSADGVATPYFGPLGRVSCRVQFGRVLGLEHDPASRGHPPTPIKSRLRH
jgi:hypothetical protein